MANDGFKGSIGRTVRESTPWWPEPARAPEGAPNVIFIVLDDVGFADLGCYGSEIRTPHMDALAAGGLRYSNFHVTAMCSPTRACLLTGRNAHSAGVGAISEWSNGFPGYEGRISRETATLAEILANHAYGTYAAGKWHLSNLANYTAAGPHPDWPLGRGFARWYGFLGGYVDHWHPDLHEDNRPIRHEPRPGYHLSEDLVDQAIQQVRDHLGSAGGRPFFTYLAFGAAHWPLHVPKDYVERWRGAYEAGWDRVREDRLARQKRLGLVPASTRLSPRNTGIPAWDDLGADERRACARLQEVYAAFMEHTDAQIGRLVAFLRQTGRLDDTLIVLLSDNGASGEGGDTGAVNIRKHMLTQKEDTAYVAAHLDLIGSDESFPHYPKGWAQVSNTPLKWFKKNTHGGGIRAPLILHWPRRITEAGAIRHQYHHVIDVVPTVLDELGISAPQTYRGVPQLPVQGIGMGYTFADGAAPTRKTIQHFEIVGDRALWHEGWKAVARHNKGEDFDQDRWELYHLDQDFSEVDDLAGQRPELVAKLVALWWSEAERYGVLPLDDRETERAFDWFRTHGETRYEYLPGMARVDRLLIPALNDTSWIIGAELAGGTAAPAGVVLACGNRFGGFSFHLADGEVVFEYLLSEATSHVLRAPLAEGARRIEVRADRTGHNAARLTLLLDGHEASTVDVPQTWTSYGITAGLTCGYANVPISRAYSPPFSLPPRVLLRVTVQIGAPPRPQAAYAHAIATQ